MKWQISTVVFAGILCFANATALPKEFAAEWEKNLGVGQIFGVEFDRSGNIITLSCGFGSMIVSSFDPKGDFLWKYLGSQKNCLHEEKNTYLPYAPILLLDKKGHIFVAGESEAFKLDPTGTLTWQKSYSNKGGTMSAKLFEDRLIISVGAEILSLDSSGNVLWQINSGIRNQGDCLGVDREGNIYTTGKYRLAKYSPLGALIWQTPEFQGFANNLRVDNQENVIITGLLDADNHPNVTRKYAPSGEMLWEKKYTADHSIYAWSEGMTLDAKGNIILNVSTWNTATLLKYDPNGNLLFQTHFGTGSSPPYNSAVEGAPLIDSAGNILLAYSKGFDWSPGALAMVSSDGKVLGEGLMTAVTGLFSAPLFSAMDRHGNLILSGYGSKMIKFSPF